MSLKYSLALGGGAARGFIHIGVLKFLEENNIQINEIAGTSMGAIVGAMAALGMSSDKIIKIAKSINYFKLVDIDFKTGLIKGNKIENKLREIFGDIQIQNLNKKLKIIATDIERSKTKIFDSGDLVSAIRASISLPGIFIPKEIDGNLYIDGGVMKNLPADILNDENILAISALKIDTGPIVKKNNILGFEFKTGFWKNNYEIIKRSIISMMKVNEDVSLSQVKGNVILIRPEFGKLDFLSFNKVDEFVQLGYNEIKEKFNIHINYMR